MCPRGSSLAHGQLGKQRSNPIWQHKLWNTYVCTLAVNLKHRTENSAAFFFSPHSTVISPISRNLLNTENSYQSVFLSQGRERQYTLSGPVKGEGMQLHLRVVRCCLVPPGTHNFQEVPLFPFCLGCLLLCKDVFCLLIMYTTYLVPSLSGTMNGQSSQFLSDFWSAAVSSLINWQNAASWTLLTAGKQCIIICMHFPWDETNMQSQQQLLVKSVYWT